MANVTFNGNYGVYFPNLFDYIDDAPVLTHSAGSVVFDLGGGDRLTLLGNFTAFDSDGRPTAGAIMKP